MITLLLDRFKKRTRKGADYEEGFSELVDEEGRDIVENSKPQ